MKIIYFDCFGGISGDMCLGSLLDAGVDSNKLEKELKKLPLKNWDLQIFKAKSHGIVGTSVKITAHNVQPHRCLKDIKDIIATSSLPITVIDKSTKIFQHLADAEGKIHGVDADNVHFHEVGAVDSIIDVVGSTLALHMLGAESIQCSPLPMGGGYIHCRHGLMPVPAPATAELLKGVPLKKMDVTGELVTPTGAAIITTLASSFGALPEMSVDIVGYGIGNYDFGIPNFLRVFIGNVANEKKFYNLEDILVMETNIDDMSPELLGYLTEKLAISGALDAFIAPVYMKKNRPGYHLTVLCFPALMDFLLELIFKETSTLGIRFRITKRAVLKRTIEEVETPYGKVRIKLARENEGTYIKAFPEYEDCKAIATEKQIPLMHVYNSALQAIKIKGYGEG